MQKLDNIFEILTNIYDITNIIHSLVIAANTENKNIAAELEELYGEKDKYIKLLTLAKDCQEGQKFFNDNKEILSKEYKKIADIEVVTLKLLKSMLGEMAQKLKGLQRSKDLLIYKKGYNNENRKL